LEERGRTRNRPVRVEDVARVAGVSPITVSRALSSPDKVKEETRNRVAAAVAATGYVVNGFASSLRSGRSSIITVFVSSLQNPHFASAVQGTIDAIEGSEYHLMFAQMGYSDAVDIDAVNAVLPFRPAAMMFTDIVHPDETRLALGQLGLPIMEMWGDGSRSIDMMVGSPIFDGGRVVGEHFGTLGFRTVAYCGHTAHRGGQRLSGFRAGLAAFGGEVAHVLSMEGTRGIADGIESLRLILAAAPECDAIFFGTDVLANGALIEAQRIGLKVPEQIAIAGYGDLDFALHTAPSLTTVRTQSYQMGRTAGEMLRRRLDEGPLAERVVLQPIELVVRESTVGALASSILAGDGST
jgi:LacI family gluconate utilization system Gnt-I transcriptional repressor